ESLTLRRELGDKHGIAESLEAFARLAAGQGQMARAARLFSAEAAWRESIGASLSSQARSQDYDDALALGRAALDEETFAAAWAEGRILTMEQAVAEALGETEGAGVKE